MMIKPKVDGKRDEKKTLLQGMFEVCQAMHEEAVPLQTKFLNWEFRGCSWGGGGRWKEAEKHAENWKIRAPMHTQ